MLKHGWRSFLLWGANVMKRHEQRHAAGDMAANECPPAAPTTEGQCTSYHANAAPTYAAKNPKRNRFASTVVFRGDGGRVWQYSGKRGRSLAMLATSGDGLTQWDTLPWHTRLAATVGVLRGDGLEIETTREGDCQHARYRLRTPGRLMVPVRARAADRREAGQ